MASFLPKPPLTNYAFSIFLLLLLVWDVRRANQISTQSLSYPSKHNFPAKIKQKILSEGLIDQLTLTLDHIFISTPLLVPFVSRGERILTLNFPIIYLSSTRLQRCDAGGVSAEGPLG